MVFEPVWSENWNEREISKIDIIPAEISGEFYQFLTSLLMRSLITGQQSSEPGVENGMFGLKLGQDWGTGRHTPTENSEEYLPPGTNLTCKNSKAVQ